MVKNSFLLLICLLGCHGSLRHTIEVRYLNSDSTYHKELADLDLFVKDFDSFYRDKSGRFFISSFYFNSKEKKNDSILVQIPELDSGSYVHEGQYLIDRSKVICVFDNSDGGNYVILNNVDPASFLIFHNVFGGRDSAHVFFQSKLLRGINPRSVKVYSSTQNCSNCEGYFVDGNTSYFESREVIDSTREIPRGFQFVE